MKKELLRRKYSPRTTKTYLYCVRRFLDYCKIEPARLTKKAIKEFMNKFVDTNATGSTINVYLSAIKFLVIEVLKKRINLKLKYSKRPKALPIVLTKNEILKIFNVVSNVKHKLMLKLMYSAGLRLSELVHLKVKDIELNQNLGWVRNGKGNKDRPFIIADKLKQEIFKYIEDNKLNHDDWLFEGNKRTHICQRTVQEIIRKATRKANIKKNIHPHTLRHSFATHLIENGYDLLTAQSLLGHTTLKSTKVYLHTASLALLKVKSPFDLL